MQDEIPTGTIVINKDGEFLTDINLIKGHWYNFVFDYFKKSLAGVTFEIYAAEDIVSPDGLNTVYYAKDTFVAEIVTNDKGIAGVEFEIRDKDGKVIETLVTDKNGHAESKEFPVDVFKDGNFVEDIQYYVVETKAAESYILDSTPHEVVLQYNDDAPEVVTYTLSLTNKPTEPKLSQTGDNMNPWLFAGVGLAAIVAGVMIFRKSKEN